MDRYTREFLKKIRQNTQLIQNPNKYRPFETYSDTMQNFNPQKHDSLPLQIVNEIINRHNKFKLNIEQTIQRLVLGAFVRSQTYQTRMIKQLARIDFMASFIEFDIKGYHNKYNDIQFYVLSPDIDFLFMDFNNSVYSSSHPFNPNNIYGSIVDFGNINNPFRKDRY